MTLSRSLPALASFTSLPGSRSPGIVSFPIPLQRDTALREIYYDPFNDVGGFLWPWTVDGSSPSDVESVAANKVGRGLSQAHFGKVFIDKKGNLKHAPRAVMNAAYTGPPRTLLGTDTLQQLRAVAQ